MRLAFQEVSAATSVLAKRPIMIPIIPRTARNRTNAPLPAESKPLRLIEKGT